MDPGALQQRLRDLKSNLENGRFNPGDQPPRIMGEKISIRRRLDGHFAKVYAIYWGKGEGRNKLVSCSQDAKLLVWNAHDTNKTNVITPRSPYVMTCAFDERASEMVCSGGLDNCVSIYRLDQNEDVTGTSPTLVQLTGHEGYISCARFIDNSKIISSSGDTTCMYFDITTGMPINFFKEHRGDVMSVCARPGSVNEFISGSVDQEVKLWDIRMKASAAKLTPYAGDINPNDIPGQQGASKMSFEGNEADVNSVKFMRNGFTFGTGSDDSSCRIFDLRCFQEVNSMRQTTMVIGVSSVDFSYSGRILFAAYEDGNCYGWDSIINQSAMGEEAVRLPRDQDKASFVATHSEGKCVAVASWDPVIKIYA